MKRDFLDTKNSHDYENLVTCTFEIWLDLIVHIILIVRILMIPHGRPRNVRDDYMRIKLQKDMHRLWAKRKMMLHLKSNNELAHQLLSPSIVHVYLL